MNKEATRSESRPCPICTGECCHTGNWIGETFKPLPQVKWKPCARSARPVLRKLPKTREAAMTTPNNGGAADLVSIGSELHARRVRGERIDALERLAYFRLLFLRQKRAGHELRLTEYGWLLQLAMKPVHLPKPRSRVELEADRDAAIAIHYHNAAMQHFCKALGIAA